MRQRFLIYLVIVTLVGSMLSWGNLLARATSGRGSGNSWYAHSFGGGGYFSGGSGGFAGASGGGHK